MKYIFMLFNWFFGIVFGLFGVIYIGISYLGALCLILISLMLLPPIRNALYLKTKIEIPFRWRGIVIFIVFTVFGIVSTNSYEAEIIEEKRLEELKVRQENIDYFIKNKESIISLARSNVSAGKHELVVEELRKYVPSNDEDVKSIYTDALKNVEAKKESERLAREKLEKESKTKELTAKVKKIPHSNYIENRDIYQELVTLNPNDAYYKSKFDYYSKKVNEKIEEDKIAREKIKKEREARINRFGEPPLRSPWDGSYNAVEKYLKFIANDPDSIDVDGCTEVYFSEKGWLVGCNYRGKNAFGGMVRQSNWFTIVNDQVIQMHDASAYKK
ncbi:hypothetical protein OLL83_000758 [Shewanella algae]|uniref:hypothetical protein n=1 Tax=Shewanella algae TaxID=38313 RepID=UPI00222EE87B|nr:hypothetical protein [Shewanella algae]UZD59241.1 hypothetical protein OLL83_000758 [Shewanella algae]